MAQAREGLFNDILLSGSLIFELEDWELLGEPPPDTADTTPEPVPVPPSRQRRPRRRRQPA